MLVPGAFQALYGLFNSVTQLYYTSGSSVRVHKYYTVTLKYA